MTLDSLLIYDVADSVATLTLNRPEKKNCFNTQVCHELATICE